MQYQPEEVMKIQEMLRNLQDFQSDIESFQSDLNFYDYDFELDDDLELEEEFRYLEKPDQERIDVTNSITNAQFAIEALKDELKNYLKNY